MENQAILDLIDPKKESEESFKTKFLSFFEQRDNDGKLDLCIQFQEVLKLVVNLYSYQIKVHCLTKSPTDKAIEHVWEGYSLALLCTVFVQQISQELVDSQ